MIALCSAGAPASRAARGNPTRTSGTPSPTSCRVRWRASTWSSSSAWTRPSAATTERCTSSVNWVRRTRRGSEPLVVEPRKYYIYIYIYYVRLLYYSRCWWLLLLSQLLCRQPSNYETCSINHGTMNACSILIFMYHSDVLLSPSTNVLFVSRFG